MNTYTFQNVTVSIEAENGKKAYDILCNKLNGSLDWITDTYSENDKENKSTVELFPLVPVKKAKKTQKEKSTNKSLLIALSALLAELAIVPDHYGSELSKAKRKALKACQNAI